METGSLYSIPHFLRIKQVLALVPVSKSQLYNMIADGAFPKPVLIGKRTSVWRSQDVMEFIEKAGTQANSVGGPGFNTNRSLLRVCCASAVPAIQATFLCLSLCELQGGEA